MIETFMSIFMSLGSSVFIPAIIIILGLILRMKPGKAVIAGLTIGIGFIGLSMVTGVMTDALGPAIELMVEKYGLSLSIMDLGSGTAGPVAFSTAMGVVIIPIAFAINIVLVYLGLTKTFNVDVWNLWQPALIGIMVWGITDSFLIGVLSMIPAFLIELILADLATPFMTKFYGFPGMTCTHIMANAGLVLAVPLNWLFDRIPGLNKIEVNPEKIQEKFGVIGDPIIIGFVIGLIIGALAGYEVPKMLTLGVQMAAVLKIMPKMVSLFMEGLTPVADATKEFTAKYMGGREVNIGMDAALVVGNSSVMSTALLMIPITLLIGVILPGNKVLPFGDLPTLVFALALMVAGFRGNVFRSVLGCSIYTVTMLYAATYLAPALTTAYHIAGYEIGSGMISYVSAGLWPNALLVFVANILSVPGLLVLTAVALGVLYYVNKVRKVQA
ncbi:PTS galactitol transporter subunit IIC [[Clostridium] innocuum]|nr:PTS transporter subunit IIC [[Clostridium] innocuum]MCG4660747.1 PTS galactitol transporter subunit IIC [[Clostridium] innocuum]